MTHKDIYTKFMIEYDKANVTSSYPSLTEYEIATVLDKAYNALIAQKVTGNNVRRSPFEADTKAVSDLQQLIKRCPETATRIHLTNIYSSSLPNDFLYYVSGNMVWKNVNHNAAKKNESAVDLAPENETAVDNILNRRMQIKLVSHDIADKFIATSNNIPWVKIPVCFIEGNKMYTVCDSWNTPYGPTSRGCIFYEFYDGDVAFREVSQVLSSVAFTDGHFYSFEQINAAFDNADIDFQSFDVGDVIQVDSEVESVDESYTKSYYFQICEETAPQVTITYIKTPNKFAKELNTPKTGWVSFFDWGTGDAPAEYTFECNDTMAEELISLAVSFALENVESQRLNSKLNMRGLEA